MSIFSGWDRESLARLKGALTSSPEGLFSLALLCLIGVAAIALVVFFASRQINGFFARVQEEDEQARLEEQEDAAQQPDAARAASTEQEV